MIYAYDKTKFPNEKPTSIADFFDIKKFPGKRALRKSVTVNLEMALMADGVPPKDVYRVLSSAKGVERAFKKLDSIKDHIIWWEDGNVPVNLLSHGVVVMSSAYNGRIFDAVVNDKKPFEIVWDGQLYQVDYWVIPKSSKNKKLALDFIINSSKPEVMAKQAEWISYGPSRKSSMALIGKHVNSGIEMLPHLPTSEANFSNSLNVDGEFWGDDIDRIKTIFNDWLTK